ncbi:hypothetical protein ACFIJ5_09275 [Haloimpatiens sp. FM7330]|uniref:hypothetical protein n=1 Tax=Haloimpatiens sp. FM7330 TaxID=3298610 RepID=UPI0036302CCF
MQKSTKLEVIYKIKESNLKYAWINTFSDLKLIELNKGKIEDILEDDLENLIEAKFFDIDKEISIIKCEDEEKFSVVEFNGKDKEYIEERQILNKNKLPFEIKKDENYKLVIRNYLNYDKDGQAYICYTQLSDIRKSDVEGGKQ